MIKILLMISFFVFGFLLIYENDFEKTYRILSKSSVGSSLFLSIVVFLILKVLFLSVFTFIFLNAVFYYIRARGKRRKLEELEIELSSAIDAVSRSLKAGLSILRSFEEVANSREGEIGMIFKEVVRMVKDGIPLTQALKLVQVNEEVEGWRLFTGVIEGAVKSGSSLSKVLSSLADMMNERRRILEKTDVLLASQRFQGVMLIFIPFVVIFVIFLIDSATIKTFLTSYEGFIVGSFALLLQISASFLIWRMTE